MARGFLLQPTYRVEKDRAVVVLHGRLETGGAFVVRDDRQQPHFYVRGIDADRARSLGARTVDTHPALRSMRDEAVVRVEVSLPSDTPRLRDSLVANGIPCFEADVRFAYRYLIDRGIRGSVEIVGDPASVRDGVTVFENPEVRPADWTPRLSVLSIDIETDPRARQLLSVALHGCGAAEVLLFTPRGMDCPPGAIPFATERALLLALARRIRALDPDVITGWNVVDFDLAVLLRMAGRLRIPFTIGREPGTVRIRESSFPRGQSQITVPGRVVLDGIQLLRGAFIRMESYSLNAVSREVLGRGKTITGSHRAEEILESWEHDRPKLVEYNLNDARLVNEILEKLHLVELSVERSRLTGMPPDRVAASIASFDFLYLSELGRRGVVAPSVGAGGTTDEATSGGHVLEPVTGLYPNVLVCDFKSLYPSIIRTFQIDPAGFLPEPGPDDDPIVAPNGAAFRREPGILPGLLDTLFPRREAAKASGDSVASQAIKILMNSFYGVLGTSACRFAAPELANAITGFGKAILLHSRDRIESRGYRVLYGDTDSLFVETGVEDAAEAREIGRRLVDELNRELGGHVRDTWGVESKLELEFEKLYVRLLLPALRHGSGGARKRYAGLVEDEDGSRRVVLTGMEAVRRDWTALAKRTQRELYEKLFHDDAVEEYLHQVVADVRAGRCDSDLVYRKALRKGLDSYDSTTPPHVAAARKMQGKPGRIISYCITTDGPEPAGERRSPIDREHYVQKQVRPVAEPILSVLGLDFDRVIGDDTQLTLF